MIGIDVLEVARLETALARRPALRSRLFSDAELAYAAGEMKHGPIALLDERTPVVTIATDSPVLDKVLSNIAEVRARGAHVLAIATDGSAQVGEHAEEVLYVPQTNWLIQPMLAIVPLQLLAYRIARARGLNVDQPRNLAKTVTVE